MKKLMKLGVRSFSGAFDLPSNQNVLSILPGTQVDELFQEGVLAPNAGDAILEIWSDLAGLMTKTDELGGLQFLEVRSTLPDELLMYADKLSMAHGLELRVPFLDKDIVEFVERLPANFKVRNGSQKWLHRQVCGTYLPNSVLKRRKRGFAVNVVDDWFRDAIDNKMADTLLDSGSKIFNIFGLHRSGHSLSGMSGRQDNHKILFSLALFEQWLRTHEDAMVSAS